MKFTFRLATVRKLRASQRDERQRRLAEAQRADEILLARIASFEDELAGAREACRAGSQPGTIDVDQLLVTQRYELVLTSQREALRGQRKQLAAEIDRRRQDLVEADRQVKVLDKLRERQWAQHEHREQLVETRRLDEIAQRQTAKERLK